MREHDEEKLDSIQSPMFEEIETRNAKVALIKRLAKIKVTMQELKLGYVYAVIESYGGDRAKASRALGMDSNYLYKFVKRYGWTEFMGRPYERSLNDQNQA